MTQAKLYDSLDILLECSRDQHKFNSFSDETKIISFSQKIPLIDPLLFLNSLSSSQQFQFYWENPSQEEAIIAYGCTKHFTINSPERFLESQKFINDCLNNTFTTGDLHLLGAGPHFFCSFTFFAEKNSFPSSVIFLPKLQIFKKKNHCVLVVNFYQKQKNTIEDIVNCFEQIGGKNLDNCFQNNSLNFFQNNVNSALQLINEKQVKKIVLAQALDLILPNNFNQVAALDRLRKSHPDCYIFSVSHGQGYNFLGASPERLLTIQNRNLITDALAGSAARGKTEAEDICLGEKLLNSEKELREHQVVSEFIVERLEALGLNPERSPLTLKKLTHIQHLWTPIQAKLEENIQPLEIVAQLHPTPAVAGVPTIKACEQIRCYENFHRDFYAAPLGWIDYQGNSKFIVGIRSALIRGNQARLYAGAGIVEGSNPAKEFAEIQLKFQFLLKALLAEIDI